MANLTKTYKVNTKHLLKNEKLVLEKLIKAAGLIADIYELQINDKFPGANFYPSDITAEELTQADGENPLILNPYTIVERNKDGRLEAIPYHIKYAKQLEPVVKLLREAADSAINKEFAKRLVVQADALELGTYEAADIYWLSMPQSKIHIVIGPIEKYEDRLMYRKNCYSATVGVMDVQATQDANDLKEALLSFEKKGFSLSQRVEASKRLQIRVDTPAILSGLDARASFAATYLPNDPVLMERYGSEIIIYKDVVKENFEDRYLPTFKKLFEKDFQKSYTEDILLSAAQKLLLIRQISVSLVKYRDANQRLGDLYSVINEMASHVLSVKNAGTLLLKDVITQKEMESMMIMLLCRAYSSITVSESVKSMTHYSLGYAIAINYFKESGALVEGQGVSWLNFTKMFVALNNLAAILERILAFGDRSDAERLIEQYGRLIPQVQF